MKDALTKYQKRERLSGSELARRLGLSRQYISMYLSGRRNMSVRRAMAVAEITGIPVMDLLRPETRSAR